MIYDTVYWLSYSTKFHIDPPHPGEEEGENDTTM